MQISVKDNIDEATTWIMRQARKMPQITATALNETAEKVTKAHKAQAAKKLDNPNPFTMKGFRYLKAGKYLNVKFFIPPIQAKYMWYQIEGGTLNDVLVPVLSNAMSVSPKRINKFGNITAKRNWGRNYEKLKRHKGDHIGRGRSGRVNVYTEQGTVGNKTRKVIYTTKSVSYKPRFDYYKIGFSVINNNFDRIFTKEWNKQIGT